MPTDEKAEKQTTAKNLADTSAPHLEHAEAKAKDKMRVVTHAWRS